MYKGYKVKAMIFAGRQESMSILMKYLKRDIEYFDEILIGVNTNNQSDLKWIYSLKNDFSNITYLELPENIKKCSAESFKYFYQFMQDEDTIYFKLDDDLVYIEEGYFEKTLKFRLKYPEYLCIYPSIVNNPLCNLFTAFNDFDKNSSIKQAMFENFTNGRLAEIVHKAFIFDKIEGDTDRWHMRDLEFNKDYHFDGVSTGSVRASINAICFFGKVFKNLHVYEMMLTNNRSDEEYLTNDIFAYNDFKHFVLGSTLVAHYSFGIQKYYLNHTNILNKYKTLANSL